VLHFTLTRATSSCGYVSRSLSIQNSTVAQSLVISETLTHSSWYD